MARAQNPEALGSSQTPQTQTQEIQKFTAPEEGSTKLEAGTRSAVELDKNSPPKVLVAVASLGKRAETQPPRSWPWFGFNAGSVRICDQSKNSKRNSVDETGIVSVLRYCDLATKADSPI